MPLRCPNRDDFYCVADKLKKYALHFLELVISAAEKFPVSGAVGSIVATSAIQASTWTNFLMLTKYHNDEGISIQMQYIMALFAGLMCANVVQAAKLANYARILHAQITNDAITRPEVLPGCPSGILWTLKGLNTAANVGSNALSTMSVIGKLSHSNDQLTTAMIVIGAVAAGMQVPATGQFLGLWHFSRNWSILTSILYTLPDSMLYANTFLFDTTPGFILLFILIALVVAPGIFLQYHGGGLFDARLKTARTTSELFPLDSLQSETVALLNPSKSKANEFLYKLGLNDSQILVLCEVITVSLKTSGIIISGCHLNSLVLKWLEEKLSSDAASGVDAVLITLVGAICPALYLSNGFIRNLLAVRGNSISDSSLQLQSAATI